MNGARRAAGELALVMVGKIASLGSMLAGAIVVARMGGAAEFGLYNVALALALLLDGAVGSPIDAAAVRFSAVHEAEPQRAVRFQAGCFRLKLLLTAGLLAAALAAGGELAEALFQDASRASLLLAAGVVVASLLLARSSAAALQASRRFRAYSLYDAALALARLGALAAAALLGAERAETYLFAQGAATFTVFLLGLIFVPQPFLLAANPSRRDWLSLGAFLGAVAWVIALGTVTGRADAPILALRQPPEVVGWYGAAAQLAAAATLLAGYASVVAQPRLVQLALRDRLGAAMALNALAAAGVAVGAVVGGLWIAPWLVPALFGESFHNAVPALQILLVGVTLDVLFMPVAMTYALQLRPRVAAAGETVVTAVFLALAPLAAGEGLLAMAWLATGVRCAKCLLYMGVALTDLPRAAERARALVGQARKQAAPPAIMPVEEG